MWTASCPEGRPEQASSATEAGAQDATSSQSPLLRSHVMAFCDVIVNGMKVSPVPPASHRSYLKSCFIHYFIRKSTCVTPNSDTLNPPVIAITAVMPLGYPQATPRHAYPNSTRLSHGLYPQLCLTTSLAPTEPQL